MGAESWSGLEVTYDVLRPRNHLLEVFTRHDEFPLPSGGEVEVSCIRNVNLWSLVILNLLPSHCDLDRRVRRD